MEEERAARTTLKPLWDHSLVGPVHLKASGGLNTMMRSKDAARGRMGASKDQIDAYKEHTRVARKAKPTHLGTPEL